MPTVSASLATMPAICTKNHVPKQSASPQVGRSAIRFLAASSKVRNTSLLHLLSLTLFTSDQDFRTFKVSHYILPSALSPPHSCDIQNTVPCFSFAFRELNISTSKGNPFSQVLKPRSFLSLPTQSSPPFFSSRTKSVLSSGRRLPSSSQFPQMVSFCNITAGFQLKAMASVSKALRIVVKNRFSKRLRYMVKLKEHLQKSSKAIGVSAEVIPTDSKDGLLRCDLNRLAVWFPGIFTCRF